MIDRRLLADFDWLLLVSALIVATLGLVTVAGIVSGSQLIPGGFLTRQIVWVCLGICFMVLTLLFDYSNLGRSAFFFYAGSILLLILVLVVGVKGYGARRWLSIGPMVFQPSELAKLAVIAMVARVINDRNQAGSLRGWELVKLGGIFLAPVVLIFIEPDLGTALILTLIGIVIVFLVGVSKMVLKRLVTWLLIIGLGLSFSHVLGFFTPTDLLKDYQLKRLQVLVHPELDPSGAGYHIRQSKIAIGSGRITGRGVGKGSQSRLDFLPAQHTDFVFAVFAESFGFLGVVLLLIPYGFLILSGFIIAREARDRFGAVLASGLTTMIAIQALINIGMTLGFLPVVGIPLPLMSYGGTAMVTTFLSIGLILNVGMRRVYFR